MSEVIALQTACSLLSGTAGTYTFRTDEANKLTTQTSPTMPPHQWTTARLAHNQKFLQAINYAKLHWTEPEYGTILKNHPEFRNRFCACVWKWFTDYEPPPGLNIDFSNSSHCLPEAEGGIWSYNHWTLRTYQHESGANPPRLFVRLRSGYYPETPHTEMPIEDFGGQEITFSITFEDHAQNSEDFGISMWLAETAEIKSGGYRYIPKYEIAYLGGTRYNALPAEPTHTFTPTGTFYLMFIIDGAWSPGLYENLFFDDLKVEATT